ncbi:hypothetical protein ES705_15658 [subsurface metagenome]
MDQVSGSYCPGDIEKSVSYNLMINIKSRTANLVKQNLGLDESTTKALFDIGLLNEEICKKVLIREEYLASNQTRLKTEVKIHLAEKYCVSFSTVEKYISGT